MSSRALFSKLAKKQPVLTTTEPKNSPSAESNSSKTRQSPRARKPNPKFKDFELDTDETKKKVSSINGKLKKDEPVKRATRKASNSSKTSTRKSSRSSSKNTDSSRNSSKNEEPSTDLNLEQEDLEETHQSSRKSSKESNNSEDGLYTPRNYGETEQKWKSRCAFAKLAKTKPSVEKINGCSVKPNDNKLAERGVGKVMACENTAVEGVLSAKPKRQKESTSNEEVKKGTENHDYGGKHDEFQIEDKNDVMKTHERGEKTTISKKRVLGGGRKKVSRRINYHAYKLNTDVEETKDSNISRAFSEPSGFDFNDDFSEPTPRISQATSNSQPSTSKTQSVTQTQSRTQNTTQNTLFKFTPPKPTSNNRRRNLLFNKNSAQSLLKSGNQMVFADDIEYIFEASLPHSANNDNLENCAENLTTAIQEFTSRVCDKDREFCEFLRDNHCILENVVSQYLDTPTAKEASENCELKNEFYTNSAVLAHVLSTSQLVKSCNRYRNTIAFIVQLFSTVVSNQISIALTHEKLEKPAMPIETVLLNCLHRIIADTKATLANAQESKMDQSNDLDESEDNDFSHLSEIDDIGKELVDDFEVLSENLWKVLELNLGNKGNNKEQVSKIFKLLAFFSKFDGFDSLKSEKSENIVSKLCKKPDDSFQLEFLETLGKLVTDKELAATRLGKFKYVWPYLTKLLTTQCYQTQLIVFSLCTSLLNSSASNRASFEKTQTTIKQVISFYKKHESIVLKYESKLGKDTEVNPDETFQVELNADEAKNLDETDQKQMKRVLNTAELHMRSTFLAANSALLLGCCVKWSKFGKTAGLLKTSTVDYGRMGVIVKKFLEFLELVHGCSDSGKKLVKELIAMFQLFDKEIKLSKK